MRRDASDETRLLGRCHVLGSSPFWRLSRAASSSPWCRNSGEQSNGQTESNGSPLPIAVRSMQCLVRAGVLACWINGPIPIDGCNGSMDIDRACSGLWNDNVVRLGLAIPRKLWSKGGSDSGPTTKILSMSEDAMESLHGKASQKHEMSADAPPMSAPCQSRDTPAALGVTEVVLGCLADGRALKRQQSIACVRYGARTVGRAPSTAVVLSRPL